MATAEDGNVEEFDSSDEEPKAEEIREKIPSDNVRECSQGITSVPIDKIASTEKGDTKSNSPSKSPREGQPNDDFIPLKGIKVPSVNKDIMEVTLVSEQKNIDENFIQVEKDNKASEFDNFEPKDNSERKMENVDDGDGELEDEFGLDRESISHQQLMDLTSKSIASLIESDPLLSDLPSDVTLEEINSQIALVQGQSISVMVAASQPAKLVVAQEGTVLDLKRSLQRHTALRLARQGRAKVKVNWRYFWRTHWLVQPGGNRLTRDSDKLKDLGIVNKTVLTYCKRLNERQR